MGEGDLLDGVDGERVNPEGVGANVGLAGGEDGTIEPGNALGSYHIVAVVPIALLESIDVVASLTDVADHKLRLVGRAAGAEERGVVEGTPRGGVGMKTYEEPLHRLVRASVKYRPCYLHGVDSIACAEGKGEVLQRIALVIIDNRISEVDGVGGVGREGVLEVDHHSFPIRDDLRLLQLRRRDDDLLKRILDGDKFVKPEGHLSGRDIELLLSRVAPDELRGLVVIGTTIGGHPIGASVDYGNRSAYQ